MWNLFLLYKDYYANSYLHKVSKQRIQMMFGYRLYEFHKSSACIAIRTMHVRSGRLYFPALFFEFP